MGGRGRNQLWPQDVAQAQQGAKRKLPRAPTAVDSGEDGTVAKINNWTVGLAGGLPEGTFLRFAAEIARNVNDPENLRVLPVVTQGATDNVKDLLYLRGIDIAITNADVLEHFKTVERIPNIEKRINFISEMVISEVHCGGAAGDQLDQGPGRQEGELPRRRAPARRPPRRSSSSGSASTSSRSTSTMRSRSRR